jgi:TctA family transporter
MGTKSASYGSGMIALFALAFTALLFTVLFQTQNSFSWVIFIMALMALSTRFFEDMKRAWLRELLFFGIIGLLLLSKYGFPF